MPVSATLAANEALAARRRLGQHGQPGLADALAAAAGRGGYGPVAGLPALREAAAGP